ncbi:hypothetical protein ACS3UN_05215 [Oscillospiraceae bacterium LTW-04]|nr:hypothetical protein RBH76_05150 [Oscillospiraceae bacterium MB24-C1]
MKKTIFFFVMICFILPELPTVKKPASSIAPKPVSFVVEAGRYAWAWADAQYYTCFALPEKEEY